MVLALRGTADEVALRTTGGKVVLRVAGKRVALSAADCEIVCGITSRRETFVESPALDFFASPDT
jgi:hypothetical protein